MATCPFQVGKLAQLRVTTNLQFVKTKQNKVLLLFSCPVVSDFVTPWAAACQSSLREFAQTHVH